MLLMKRRYENPKAIEEEIDRCKRKAQSLLERAEGLDYSASQLFKMGGYEVEAKQKRDEADRCRKHVSTLIDTRIPKLIRKLAEMNTLPMHPIIGNDVSVPVRLT